jgi:transaldolase
MGYFRRVQSGTPTRFWINNPTPAETRLAIAAGAIACTTNPTFAAKVIAADPAGAAAAVDAAVRETPNDHAAADLVQRSLCRPILDAFRPLYDRDPLRQGWVSVQGDPTAEDDPRDIVSSMRAARELGPNVIAKIPVTVAGLEAIGTLAAEGVPIIATEVMAVSQAMAAVEAWSRATAKDRAGRFPPLYVTHITGILEEHLVAAAARAGVAVDPADLSAGSVALAHRQFRLLASRGVPARMLGGGARGLHHFTGMVGLDMDVTINWSGTADELERRDGPVVDRSRESEPREIVAKLRDLLPDFRRAWDEDGLVPAEFADFGPVALFRGRFVEGWRKLLALIRQRRDGGREIGR